MDGAIAINEPKILFDALPRQQGANCSNRRKVRLTGYDERQDDILPKNDDESEFWVSCWDRDNLAQCQSPDLHIFGHGDRSMPSAR